MIFLFEVPLYFKLLIFFNFYLLKFFFACHQFVLHCSKVFNSELDEIFDIKKFLFMISFNNLLNSVSNVLLELKANILHACVVKL